MIYSALLECVERITTSVRDLRVGVDYGTCVYFVGLMRVENGGVGVT
jgi:hypothetical protein